MHFHRAQPSIVRSIRHVSMVKDWTRARRTDALPHFSQFVPDERAGDAADLMIAEARREGDEICFYCRSAGARIEQMLDRPIADDKMRDCIDANLMVAARPIWQACVSNRMPMFSVVPVNDRDGRLVTIEQIYLPYRSAGEHADMIVSSVHAWSPEGRFSIQGLLRNVATVPTDGVVFIDPSLVADVAGHNDLIENS